MKTIVETSTGFQRFVIKSNCKSTLGKRKVSCVSQGHKSEISLVVSSQARKPYADFELSANCWVKDSEERQIAIVLNHSTLIALHAELDKMIQHIKADGGLYQEPTN